MDMKGNKMKLESIYEYDKETKRLYKTLTYDYVLLRDNKRPLDFEDNVVTMKGIEWVLRYYLVHDDFERTMKELNS